MRSLRLNRYLVLNIPDISDDCIAINSDSKIAISSHNQLYIGEEDGKFEEVPLSCKSRLVSISFVMDGSLWIFHESGVVSKFEPESFELEVIGEQEGGIMAVKWSPDGELVVIVGGELTNDESLQLLTSDFDPIATQPAVTLESGEEVMVNVGWGSRATQFMGAAGKEIREQEIKPADKLSSLDDHCISLCWRGDSELFCTSVPFSTGRKTRIYSREGVHLCTTSTSAALLGPISWRSSSLLSALAQHISGNVIVSQIERNGLDHGEIELIKNDKNESVKRLVWNSLGTLLAVQYESHVEFWRQGNYHWYRQLSIKAKKASYLWWDEMESSKLWILQPGVNLIAYNAEQFVNHSEAEIIVPNGEKINYTNYTRGMIPPPMSELVFPSHESSPSAATKSGVVIAHEKQILKYTTEDPEKREILAEHNVQNITEICAYGENRILVHGAESTDTKLELFFKNSEIWSKIEMSVENCFLSQICFSGENTFFGVQHDNGGFDFTIFKGTVDVENKLIKSEDIAVYSRPVKFLSYLNGNPVYTVQNQPYYGDEKLTLENGESVLSLSRHNKFLVCTTTKHELIIWKAEDLEKDAKNGIGVRRGCERGANIVMSYDTKVVLQMPRGNIETIEPRMLLLAKVAEVLNVPSVDWKSVFKMFRRQRVNLNLLVDHSGIEQFPVADFFSQLMVKAGKNEIAAFNTFLFELEEQDCTKKNGMYFEIYRRSDEAAGDAKPKKIEKVCLEICKAIENDMTNIEKTLSIYLQCQLKVYGMDATLIALSKLISENKENPIPENDIKSGIKFLAVMQQGQHELYHYALKSYDLDLALLTAQAIDMDPKEYLDNLNVLDKEPNLVKRGYFIDNQLELYEEAVEKLIKLNSNDPEIPSVSSYVVKHNLFSHTIRLKTISKSLKQEICRFWAQKMQAGDHKLQAAILFRQSDSPAKAEKLFILRNRWKLGASKNTKDSPQDYDSMAQADAASMCWSLTQDPEESVRLFVNAFKWDDAFMVSNLSGRPDLIQTEITPAIKLQGEAQVDRLETISREWSDRLARILELREEQQKKIQLIRDGYDEEQGDFCDMVSDMGSVRTGTTNRSRTSKSTAKSSKNRKKAERKKFSVRRGSPMEHLGLMEEAKSSVESFERLMDETGDFLVTLGYNGEFEIGFKIQKYIKNHLNSLEQTLAKIWPKDEEGLDLLESFQKEGTLRDLRDLSVLSPPTQPRKFHNFSIFE